MADPNEVQQLKHVLPESYWGTQRLWDGHERERMKLVTRFLRIHRQFDKNLLLTNKKNHKMEVTPNRRVCNSFSELERPDGFLHVFSRHWLQVPAIRTSLETWRLGEPDLVFWLECAVCCPKHWTIVLMGGHGAILKKPEGFLVR